MRVRALPPIELRSPEPLREQAFIAVISLDASDTPNSSKVEGSIRAGPRMEPLWSPVVATHGSQRQIDRRPKPHEQAKSIATGCHRLRATFHGKEGVDGSSPSEGLKNPPQISGFL